MGFLENKYIAKPIQQAPLTSGRGTIANKYLNATGEIVPARTGGSISSKYLQNTLRADSPTTESLEAIDRYNQKLLEVGIEPPKSKPVMGTVNRILDVLRTGEYAVGGILAGKGPIAGIKEDISPSEVFGITTKETKSIWGLLTQPAFYGALAVDIILDPTTYLTFGYGSGAKISTTIGSKVLNKSGQKLLKKATKQFGEDAARRMISTSILKEGGEKYLAKGGLKFMGKEFIPRKIVQAPFAAINHGIEKTPFVGTAFIKTKQMAKKAFKPFASINELPAQLGGDGRFEEMVLTTQKGIRGKTKRKLEYLNILAKEAYKSGIKNPGKLITDAIEFDVKTGSRAMDDIASYMADSLQKMGFAEQRRGILGEAVDVHIPGYMRHFLTKEGKEFLETQGKKVQEEFINNVKEFRVRAPFAKGRKLKAPINDINNIYKEKYGVQLFEPDAFKSFAGRTAEHIKATQMYDFFQNLVDERLAIRAQRVPQLIKRTKGGLAISHKRATETMIDGVKMVETKVPQLEGFLVAEPVAKHLDMVHAMMTKDEVAQGLLGLYDNVLNFWKGSVTGWFPAFHSRNMIGGIFNNWLGGVNNPLRYRQAEDIIRGKEGSITSKVTGTKYTYDEVRRLTEDLGVTGAPGMIDMMRDVEDMIKIGQRSKIGQIKNFPRVAMEAVEDRLRIPMFVDRLIKGDTPQQAAKHVFQYHFDYAPEAFTAFERNVMKRIVPFYTWTRNNTPLQIRELMKQPGKYASLEKTRREIEDAAGAETEEDEKYLPTWMKEMFLFRLPGEGKDGLPRYLQVDLPLEDLNKLPFTESGRRELIALLSPFLKYPVERIANRNLYFGSEVFDASLPQEYQTSKAIEALKFLPPGLKNFLNFHETQIRNSQTGQLMNAYEMDSIKLHFIRSLLAGRFYSTIGSATDSELDVWMKLSRLFGGVPIRSVDIEEEKYRRAKEQEVLSRETVNYLQRRAIILREKDKQAQGFQQL